MSCKKQEEITDVRDQPDVIDKVLLSRQGYVQQLTN